MKIFISHIQEEFQVALVLKKWVQSAFAERCEVLISTDPENIPTVAQFVERSERVSEEIKGLMILCSPSSIQSPWIPFEAGSAWVRKISIIPICYAGLTLAELPPPLSTFSGFELGQRDFGQKLFMTLAKELGIAELPPIQYRQMRQEINQVLETLPGGATDFGRATGGKQAGGQPLESIHVQILLVLNESQGYTSAVLAQHFRTEEKKILPVLKRMTEEHYLYASPAGIGHVRYNISKKGKDYLKENGLV